MRESVPFRIQWPDRRVVLPAISFLRLRLEDGHAGFGPNHAPCLALVPAGEVEVETPEGRQRFDLGESWLWIRREEFSLHCRDSAPRPDEERLERLLERVLRAWRC